MALVTLEMIREAQEHLKGVAQRTAMMHSTSLSEQCGCEVHLKWRTSSVPVHSNCAVRITR